MANGKTVIKFLKDVSAEFGTKGDVYANDVEQMAKLDAYVAKRKLGKVYEVVKGEVEKVAKDVESDVEKVAGKSSSKSA